TGAVRGVGQGDPLRTVCTLRSGRGGRTIVRGIGPRIRLGRDRRHQLPGLRSPRISPSGSQPTAGDDGQRGGVPSGSAVGAGSGPPMRWLSDTVVSRLQSEMQLPDLSGTRYRAVRFVARGGMGTVWLAQDTVLERNVALKILAPENSSADLAARLLHEAAVLAQLEHPGIVPVHDAGTLLDGRTFYCMKYVEGQTLDQYIAGTSLRERLQLLQRIAEPLAFAHSRGIIHRDLKPGNVMIGAFGEVLVMDWGLAKVTGDKPGGGSAGYREGSPEPKSTGHGSVFALIEG